MRRRGLLGLLAAAPWLACDRKAPTPAPRTAATSAATTAAAAANQPWRELSFAASPHYDEPELATLLAQRDSPILVALHGRGEAGRGLEAGARGWRDDYDLSIAASRLASPPLKSADLHGFVTAERLAQLNASLKKDPYRGVAVACPYTPALFDRSVEGAKPFAGFITEVLLPRVRQELGAAAQRTRTGIDGVSMGGRLALLVGLSHPDVFGAVGAMQPAIGPQEASWLADLAAEASREPLHLRLMSSQDDPFLDAVKALSAALDERKVAHQLLITPGPHDYIYNRGPGSYEMLLWHERVLRGLPPP